MSLILDALRKSEAERQRGQAPGLFVQQALPPRRRHRPVSAWIAGGAVIAAVGVLAWFGGQRLGLVGEHAPTPAVEAAAPPSPDAAPLTAAGAMPAPTPTTTPEPEPPPTAPAPATEPAISGPPTGSPAPAPAPTPMPTQLAPAPSTATTTPPAPPIEGYVVDTRPPNEIPATPDLREAPPPKAPPAGDDTATLPRLADLPAGERAALPPLRLSMHVYAEDPAQRFVILDGRRLGEGGVLSEGVSVQSIRRDGLVVSVRGQPYWLAR